MVDLGRVERNVEVLSALFGCFGQASDTGRLAIYARILRDVPTDLLRAACEKVMLECRFLPSVAEVVAAVRVLDGVRAGRRALSWEEAWEEVVREMRRCGVYGSPVFSSELIGRAVRAVGWRNLCCADEGAFSVLHAQFREVYKRLVRCEVERSVCSYVLGGESGGVRFLPGGKE